MKRKTGKFTSAYAKQQPRTAFIQPGATLNGKATTVRLGDGFVEWGDVANPVARTETRAAEDFEPAVESAASVHAWFGPEEAHLRTRLGSAATFLGWLAPDALASVYASADLLVFPSTTDTFGRVILEAQASGLPVVAVAEGGPLSLITDGETGRLAPPEPAALADAVLDLVRDELQRERIRRAALSAAQGRTWQGSMEQLAAGYRAALTGAAVASRRQVA